MRQEVAILSEGKIHLDVATLVDAANGYAVLPEEFKIMILFNPLRTPIRERLGLLVAVL